MIKQYDYKSEYLKILQERGFLHAITDPEGLDQKMQTGPVTAYIGFDCTAPSLHIGSLVQIMMLVWLQKTGHTPLIVMGGGTTKVGDPSGKDQSRQLLDDVAIDKNMTEIQSIFAQFIDFESEDDKASNSNDTKASNLAKMINNNDWLSDINYIDFLRDYGKHFSVNRMMSFDSVKLRLEREQNLSFLEFNYMILQSYDFTELYKKYGCTLQMGGSDQWGNIVSGIDLARRIYAKPLFGLTTPLLTTASGAKMGKTADGAIWLNETQLSNWDYWQYWRNIDDADVGRFLRLFTLLPLDEISKLEALEGAEINEAKKILATEVTKLSRGHHAAQEILKAAQNSFEQGKNSGFPKIYMSGDMDVISLLVDNDLAPSRSEAKRLIKGGGIKLNDVAIKNFEDIITPNQQKFSVGKKKHFHLNKKET